jgi:hypothetical protein
MCITRVCSVCATPSLFRTGAALISMPLLGRAATFTCVGVHDPDERAQAPRYGFDHDLCDLGSLSGPSNPKHRLAVIIL